MITPNIIYYARLSLERNGSKTPKYVITATAGNYAPMEKLKGLTVVSLCSSFLKRATNQVRHR